MNMTSIQNLSYNEYAQNHSSFNCGTYLACSLIEKFALISLLGFITRAVKKKNPNCTTFDVLYKIIKDKNINREFLYNICIITDDFTENIENFELFGLKTQKDIIDKINSILENWLPF